jgi:hypothetical protein
MRQTFLIAVGFGKLAIAANCPRAGWAKYKKAFFAAVFSRRTHSPASKLAGVLKQTAKGIGSAVTGTMLSLRPLPACWQVNKFGS